MTSPPPVSAAAPVWRSRRGTVHPERPPTPHGDEPRMIRVTGRLERAWSQPADRASLVAAALAEPNPQVTTDPDDSANTVWSWLVEAADATAAVLWTNPVFDHADLSRAELTRLPGSDLWTISLRLPAGLRASYRIGIWSKPEPPPWRTATGRREVILAALRAGAVDPRGSATLRTADDGVFSVAAGPLAPAEPWLALDPTRTTGSRVDELSLPYGERAWVYAPHPGSEPTPLLVLFDGQVWRQLDLPAILDAVIGAGLLPPLHAALLDSGSQPERWARLGVPAGQVDTVIDRLLPRVRSGWAVDPTGDRTLVAGQSLGGLAAVWTLALAGGDVRHAIAQSPSLWRFEIAEALLAEPRWSSLDLQAGSFESDMLADAQALAAALHGDPRLADRTVDCRSVEAGHDWAAWRANLVQELVDHYHRPTPAQR